jgi:hypothetical protein
VLEEVRVARQSRTEHRIWLTTEATPGHLPPGGGGGAEAIFGKVLPCTIYAGGRLFVHRRTGSVAHEMPWGVLIPAERIAANGTVLSSGDIEAILIFNKHFQCYEYVVRCYLMKGAAIGLL